MRRPLLALATAAALLFGACGSDDDPTTEAEDTEPLATCDGTVDAVTVSGDFGAEPTVAVESVAVERSQCEVLIEGDGDAAEDGDIVVFHYVFVNGRTGYVWDSSFSRGQPGTAVLNDNVIRGVRTGLLGARPGTRVVVAISPDDGYGLQGGDPENGLEADDTLVFVADVEDVRRPLDRAEGTGVAPVAGLPTVALDDAGRPTIVPPEAEPPAELVAQLLIEGDGPVVEAGQTIIVHYVGVLWASSQEFDSSWEGTPTEFVIGAGAVISGWDRGLVGQKVGSQVMLVVPPADGYGEGGAPAAGISGTDTLVFVVDILLAR